MRAALPRLKWGRKKWWIVFILPQRIHREKFERAFVPPSTWNNREAASKGVVRTTNAVEGWHFGIQAFFSGSHRSLWRTLETLKKDAATQKYLCLQSTAVRSFRGKKVPRTGSEGENRNWTSSGWKNNCLPQSDGFLVNIKLNIMNKFLKILRVSCLSFQKIQFSRKLQGFSQRKLSKVFRTISGFFLSPLTPSRPSKSRKLGVWENRDSEILKILEIFGC